MRRLYNNMDMAWCIAMFLMLMLVCLMLLLGILSLSCRRVMIVTCVDARALAMSTKRGATD
jgi:hypothetical protein